ncbi:MAG: A/G-specific adenine glycosylase, partial [Rikenellaceae bacterium]|nr:A/G-specific adenine glycosylase [Rikenellaceae bacterium]
MPTEKHTTEPISAILTEWYETHRRALPWRESRNPYTIWISEVVLQQTRVVQGLDYFYRFMARFPDVASLAAAGEDEVMKYWQGLGYYSRARSLHVAARQVVERFGGRFPTTYEDVLSLKGVGEYTAAAICSFAYEQPYAVVDGNVYRVLARLF